MNLTPLGPTDAIPNPIANQNITTLALEVPISCLARGNEPVIGGWTTASVRQARILNPSPNFDKRRPPQISGGAWSQVSRLGMPLVNEVVIGLKDKDRFNASQPRDGSGAFAALAVFLGLAFVTGGVLAPGGPWMIAEFAALLVLALRRPRESSRWTDGIRGQAP